MPADQFQTDSQDQTGGGQKDNITAPRLLQVTAAAAGSAAKQSEQHQTSVFSSCRLFSEGGDFAPQELRMFQRRMREETKRIVVAEESIYSGLEAFESKSLQQVQCCFDL